MSARIMIVVFAALLLGACSSVKTVQVSDGESSYRDVNRGVRGKVVRMELRDGSEMDVVGVHVASDSVTWIDQRSNSLRGVATDQVRQLSVVKAGAGAVRGLLVGVVAGAAVGGLRAAVEGDDPSSDPFGISQGEKYRVYPAAHAAYASLATTPIGAIIGTRRVYRFDESSGDFASEK